MANQFSCRVETEEEFICNEFHKFLRKTVREINFRREQTAVWEKHAAVYESVSEYYVKETLLGIIDVPKR